MWLSPQTAIKVISAPECGGVSMHSEASATILCKTSGDIPI